MGNYECRDCARRFNEYAERQTHEITHRRLRAKKAVPAFAPRPGSALDDGPSQAEVDAALASIGKAVSNGGG